MANGRRKKRTRETVSVAIHDLGRLRKIFGVVTRHGFHQFVGRRGLLRFVGARLIPPDDPDLAVLDLPDMAALRFRRVLEELGPTFIKMGQVLSTRPDLLPAAFVRELEVLQDDAPPLPFEAIRQVVEASLGSPLAALYDHFEEVPIAAASMAQVHAARTLEGHDVVVKVIRPGVRELIEADLDLLHLLARMLEASIAEMELYAPGELVATFDAALKSELDLRGEAEAIREMAESLASVKRLAIPKVYDELSAVSVLTLERFYGHKVTAVETGSEVAKALVKVGLEATFKQIFEVGLFHGDPHPGNLMWLDDGRLGMIDFGLVGRLTAAQQDTLVNLLVSVVTGDIDGIVRVVLKMGRPLGHVDLGALRETAAEIRRRHLKGSLQEVDAARFVQDLLEAGQRFRIRIAPEYAILAKASVTVEGVLRAVDPEIDIVTTARPFAKRLMQQRVSGKRLVKSGLKTALGLGSFVRDLPQHLDQILLDLNAGTLRIEVRNTSMDALGSQLNVLATRLFMALLAAGLFVAAAILVRDDPWPLLGIPLATVLAMGFAVFFSVVGLAWHALGAGSGKLSLGFIGRLLERRRLANESHWDGSPTRDGDG